MSFLRRAIPACLCADSYLASLVLGDLVLGVLLAVLALAVGAASLGDVDLKKSSRQLLLFALFIAPPSIIVFRCR